MESKSALVTQTFTKRKLPVDMETGGSVKKLKTASKDSKTSVKTEQKAKKPSKKPSQSKKPSKKVEQKEKKEKKERKARKPKQRLANITDPPVDEAKMYELCSKLNNKTCTGKQSCANCCNLVVAGNVQDSLCLPLAEIRAIKESKQIENPSASSQYSKTMRVYSMYRLMEITIRKWGSWEALQEERVKRDKKAAENADKKNKQPKPKRQFPAVRWRTPKNCCPYGWCEGAYKFHSEDGCCYTTDDDRDRYRGYTDDGLPYCDDRFQ